MTVGYIVFAHGSRVESANQAVRTVAADFARSAAFSHVEAAFLELGVPNLEGAADRLVAQGAKRIVVIPYFLTLGLHMERDLPALVDSISKKHKDISITVTAPLDGHPALVEILKARAAESA